ncbi:MAG: GNAT family N-acetyltransferase [Terriglobales bacterium]
MHGGVIRHAGPADAAGVLACLLAAFAPYRGAYTEAAFRDTVLDEASVPRRLDEWCVLVAEAPAGAIAGTVGGAASGSDGHIRGMAVRPEFAGSGMAQALLDAIEAELRSRGAVRITLDTTRPLRRAMRFYERNGYRRTGVERDFFAMPLIEYAKAL